jgi:DNA-binding beta-propeller fold protein YncE
VSQVHGVTFDGSAVWMATGHALKSFDPASGRPLRSLPVAAEAGTAFDGRHLYQLAGAKIQKVDPRTGEVVATLPAPEPGPHAGLTWAEGTLWVARYRQKQIVQIDPQTGRVLRTLESTRFVTGVAWVEGELWHGARGQKSGENDELLRVDPASGAVLDLLVMPEGTQVSGVESGGEDVLFCGGGTSGTVRAIRRSSAG